MLKLQKLLPFLLMFAILANSALGNTLFALPSKDDPSNLLWKGRSIKVAISSSLTNPSPNIKIGSDVAGAIQRSIAAWQDVTPIKIFTQHSDKQSVSQAGVTGDGVSLITIAATPENVLFFGKEQETMSARTRIFYNRRGFITESDIALNPFQQFSTDGTFGTFDLESTLRHEIGHLLGLRHSSVIGSVMYDSKASNGVFGMVTEQSVLSGDDISAIRSIYGSNVTDERCCGSISGKIVSSRRGFREFSVWLQEIGTGRIVASTNANRIGAFKFNGLPEGVYSVFASEVTKDNEFSTQKLGDVTVSNETITSFSGKYARKTIDSSIEVLGLNGVLSDSPINLNRGNFYTVFAGGKNLTTEQIGIDSPYISIVPDSFSKIEYSDAVSVVSFQIDIDSKTPPGQYSVYAISENGEMDYCLGGISIGVK